MSDWEFIDDISQSKPESIDDIFQSKPESLFNNNEQISIFRAVFNAPFYKNVGFITKRAADSIMSFDFNKNIYICAMNAIMRVVEEERLKVKEYFLTKHKLDIDAANVRDKKLSSELRVKRFVEQARNHIALLDISNDKEYVEQETTQYRSDDKEYVEQARKNIASNEKHFHMIMKICNSDTDNKVSQKIMSYMEQNNLIYKGKDE